MTTLHRLDSSVPRALQVAVTMLGDGFLPTLRRLDEARPEWAFMAYMVLPAAVAVGFFYLLQARSNQTLITGSPRPASRRQSASCQT